jgi:integrase
MSSRWNWADFERALLWVRKAKIGDDLPSQRVALSPRAAAALRTWGPAKESELKAAADRLIFPTRDGKPRTNIARHLERILPHAGVDPAGVSAHTFRHTFITLLDHAGVRARVRQALARHVSGTMTDHYTHQDYDDQRAALELLEAQVMRETVLRVVTTRTAAAGG